MMLTHEQLAELLKDMRSSSQFENSAPVGIHADECRTIIAHIDAQQARIAELEAESAVLLERIDKTLKEAVSFMNERNAHRDRVADLELALFAENQKRKDVEKDAERYQYIANGCTIILPCGTECEDQRQLDEAMK